MRLELVDHHAADFHTTAAGVQEPGDDLAERRLARAARADDGQSLARRDVEVDAVEHERAFVVAEHHVVDVHADRGGRALGWLRHLPHGPVGGKLGDPDEPGERRGGALHLVGLLEQRGDGIEELHQIERRRAQRPDLDGAVVDERGARGHHRHQRHRLRKADARAHAVARRGRGHLGVDGDPTATGESRRARPRAGRNPASTAAP